MKKNVLFCYGIVFLFLCIATAPTIIAISKSDYHFQNEESGRLGIHKRHRLIIINGNNGFIRRNGVIGGSGTEEDPYIISGWRFNSIFWNIFRSLSEFIYIFITPNAITISNTDKHVIIRDNIFLGWGGHSIRGKNVANISIESNTIKGNGNGILLENVKNIDIDSNTFSKHNHGVSIIGVNKTTIRNNTFTECTIPIGITGKNIYIEKNLISNCKGGIETYYGKNVYIRDNEFAWIDSDYYYVIGIYKINGDSVIENSYIHDCKFISGIHFLETNSVLIFRNNTLERTDGYTLIGNKGLIENNTFNRCDFAIRVGSSIIQNNFVKSSFVGINIDEMCYVYNNTIQGNHVGINCPWKSKNIPIIANNFIENNDCGISCSENIQIQVNNNYISGNDQGFSYGGNKILNATMNWWGASNGPSGKGPGDGDTVSKNIDFEPWLNSSHPDAPLEPNLKGPEQGFIETEYTFTISTTDPNNNDVYYFVNWGDGTATNLIGPYTSGEEITLTHTWSEKDDYVIKVRAQDINGHWSFWSLLGIELQKDVTLNTPKIHDE